MRVSVMPASFSRVCPVCGALSTTTSEKRWWSWARMARTASSSMSQEPTVHMMTVASMSAPAPSSQPRAQAASTSSTRGSFSG